MLVLPDNKRCSTSMQEQRWTGTSAQLKRWQRGGFHWYHRATTEIAFWWKFITNVYPFVFQKCQHICQKLFACWSNGLFPVFLAKICGYPGTAKRGISRSWKPTDDQFHKLSVGCVVPPIFTDPKNKSSSTWTFIILINLIILIILILIILIMNM